ncbi:MAG: hypothetical protein U1F36_02145 [Planctomycetota bacterium]
MSEVLASFEVRGRPLTIRIGETADDPALVDCFNAIFPVDHPGVPPMDLATWRWKYRAPGLDRREMVVALHEEVGVVGAYPSQPLRALREGSPVRTAQITDLMVRHAWRRIGERPGIFVQMGRIYYDLFCGAGDDRQGFNYGWPVPAWRIGQRYLDYENVRDWNFLAREIPADLSALCAVPAGLEIREVARFGPDADELFRRAAAGARFTLVKDQLWLNWRYADHPSGRYRMFEVRDRSGLRAIGVDCRGDLLRPNTSFLVDCIVPAADGEALRAVVAAAERRAHRDGTGALAGVWSPADPRFRQLCQLGYDTWDSGYFLVVAAFVIDSMFLRDAWHFTMGESDLI